MSNDILTILSGLETLLPENEILLRQLRTAIDRYPNANWNDAFSKGQLVSKLWLINRLKSLDINLGTVFIMGGWVGVLPLLMFRDNDLKFDKIRTFDIDPDCAGAADTLNRNQVINDWRFKASTADMFDINYYDASYKTLRANGETVLLNEKPDTIINTSCDHIAPFGRWWEKIPKGRLMIIQNNNFFGADEDHVNNINSLDEMKDQAPMSELLLADQLEFPRYTRFMLIGRK